MKYGSSWKLVRKDLCGCEPTNILPVAVKGTVCQFSVFKESYNTLFELLKYSLTECTVDILNGSASDSEKYHFANPDHQQTVEGTAALAVLSEHHLTTPIVDWWTTTVPVAMQIMNH